MQLKSITKEYIMPDWKAIAFTYASAYAAMREAAWADRQDHIIFYNRALELIASIPIEAIKELVDYQPPDPTENFEWRDEMKNGSHWFRRDAERGGDHE